MLKLIIFFIIFFYIQVNASVIPENKCAIITGASKSEEVTLKALKKYSEFSNPIAVKSNNGYFAMSVGIFNKSESKSIIKDLKAKKLIPKDSYCGNVDRFIAILYPNSDYSVLGDNPSKNQNAQENSSTEKLIQEIEIVKKINQDLKSENNKWEKNIEKQSIEIRNLKQNNKNLEIEISQLINEIEILRSDAEKNSNAKVSNNQNEHIENLNIIKKENEDLKKEIAKLTNMVDRLNSDLDKKLKDTNSPNDDPIKATVTCNFSNETRINTKGKWLESKSDPISLIDMFGMEGLEVPLKQSLIKKLDSTKPFIAGEIKEGKVFLMGTDTGIETKLISKENDIITFYDGYCLISFG